MRPAALAPLGLALLGLVPLLVAPQGFAAATLDPGEAVLRGHATDLVQRVLVLDLWDAGQPPRTYTLRASPDSDALSGVEARARAIQGREEGWRSLEEFRLQAGPDKRAQERGWDGLYELALRVRLPNREHARLALLLVEEGNAEALAITTRLEARLLAFEARLEDQSGVRTLKAIVQGGKTPEGIEAFEGSRRWPLSPDGDAWRLRVPPGVESVSLVARFPDGGVLEGPRVAVGPQGQAAPGAPEAAQPSGASNASAATPAGPQAKPDAGEDSLEATRRVAPPGEAAGSEAREHASGPQGARPRLPLLRLPGPGAALAAATLAFASILSRRGRAPP